MWETFFNSLPKFRLTLLTLLLACFVLTAGFVKADDTYVIQYINSGEGIHSARLVCAHSQTQAHLPLAFCLRKIRFDLKNASPLFREPICSTDMRLIEVLEAPSSFQGKTVKKFFGTGDLEIEDQAGNKEMVFSEFGDIIGLVETGNDHLDIHPIFDSLYKYIAYESDILRLPVGFLAFSDSTLTPPIVKRYQEIVTSLSSDPFNFSFPTTSSSVLDESPQQQWLLGFAHLFIAREEVSMGKMRNQEAAEASAKLLLEQGRDPDFSASLFEYCRSLLKADSDTYFPFILEIFKELLKHEKDEDFLRRSDLPSKRLMSALLEALPPLSLDISKKSTSRDVLSGVIKHLNSSLARDPVQTKRLFDVYYTIYSELLNRRQDSGTLNKYPLQMVSSVWMLSWVNPVIAPKNLKTAKELQSTFSTSPLTRDWEKPVPNKLNNAREQFLIRLYHFLVNLHSAEDFQGQ